MQILKKNFYLIFTIAILVILAGGGTLVLNSFFHLDSYKDQLLAELQTSLNRKVTYEKGVFSFRFGASFSFTNIVVLDKDGVSKFVTADKLTFKIALLPLLEKRVVMKELVLDKPQIFLNRDKSGVFNISDLLEEKREAAPFQIRGIRIKKGRINFRDLAVAPESVHTLLEDTDFSISHAMRGKVCDFKLSTFVANQEKKGVITLAGSAKLAEKDKPLSDTPVNASILVKNLDAEHYWPYYKAFVPFRKVLGYLDMDSVFKGKLSEFTSKGTVRIAGLRFDYPAVFHAVLTPATVKFNYDMELTPKDISVKSLDLSVDALKVTGSCRIMDIPSRDPRITAQAKTSSFRLEDFHQYIPYGIIAHDASVYIEQHIKGGTYKLDYGRLDGRVSQIAHMERGDNYNVLAIRGTVEKGLITYGPDVPTFNAIKGDLEMKGKDFLLHRMTANFGGSPFTLEGKIADYPLNTPSSYPFGMTMTPRQAEIAWLFGREAGKKLRYTGESTLRLTGDGYTNGYNLSGEWNLTPAAYSYPDLVVKPVGRLNLLSFKGSVNNQEARLSSLQYNLSPMALSISADYRFTDKRQLALSIKSNRFQVGEVTSLLPAIEKYKPSGRLQGVIRGESPTGTFTDLLWGGNITFSGFSFKPSEQVNPVSNMTGNIIFNGTSLETSQLTAKLGNSTIYCKGSMVGFKNPTLNLAFSAPLLDMADLGLHAHHKEVKATRVQGNIALKDNNLQIRSLSGQIGNSSASIKGNINDINNPKIDISVTSTNMELEDLLLLTELEKPEKKESPHNGLHLKATIRAETGSYKDIDFDKLVTTVMLENRILYLQPLELDALGGHVSGKARLDLGSTVSPPRYQISYNLDKVSAESLTQAFGIEKREVSGTVSLQGELTARGNSSAELKKTALGSLKLKCEKGSLRKFPVLSKIFSILNVSQLFKLHLPDMVAGGMPYNSITATISIQDGIASSQDFYIASNAMNMSAVGKVDLVKNELDATIGVQPLQSVGKVVNRLPVVGWILTGEKKTFLTPYFEAKGRLDDPTVKAVPVSSIAKGVFNVFKRVFELPGKLFTDTGEVLVGK